MKTNYPIERIDLRHQLDHITPENFQYQSDEEKLI